MYSEDFLSACIKSVKNSLDTLIYPLMEALSPSPLVQTHYAPALLLAMIDSPDSNFKQRIDIIHTSITAIIPLLNSLIESVGQTISMSESIIIQITYISIKCLNGVSSLLDTIGRTYIVQGSVLQ